MAVYVSNIVINSGTTFSETFTLESAETNAAFDLTGYSGAAQMRKHAVLQPDMILLFLSLLQLQMDKLF